MLDERQGEKVQAWRQRAAELREKAPRLADLHVRTGLLSAAAAWEAMAEEAENKPLVEVGSTLSSSDEP